MGAARLRGVGLALGERDEPRREQAEARQQDLLDRFAVAPGVRGVDDVHRRRAEMHEPARVLGDPVADLVHQGADVVADARFLGVHLGGADPTGGLRDRVGGLLGGEALLGERARERGLGLRLRAHAPFFGEVRVERRVELLVTAVEPRVEGRDRVEARGERHGDRILAAIDCRIVWMRDASAGSPSAMISAARMAAFAAPASPTATVATGTPRGIWTIESSASRPPAIALGDASGTPTTGSVTCAATAPGRAAAPPAAAMTTWKRPSPRPRAPARSSSGGPGACITTDSSSN